MKTVYRYSYLLLLLIPLFLSHCGNSGDPTQTQAVTISDMWVSNLTDYDQDGYYSFFNLYFDLDINEGSKKAYVVIAVRFYDSADTAIYHELFSTDDFDIQPEDEALYVDVELPSNSFPTAGYDFLFLVLDSNDPKIRLAEMSASDQELLSNVPLEHIESDAAVILNNMGVSDSVDMDEDGYKSSFHFNFLLEPLGGSKEVYVVLAERNHDPDDQESYSGYLESENFTVDPDDGMVLIDMPIDNSDAYFSQDIYDFIFLVLDANVRDLRLIETSATDNPRLRSVMIEPTDTDNNIFIYDAWFADTVDIDVDGYNSEAWLVFDVDEVNGSGEDVYMDISYKEIGTSTYLPFVRTEKFTVTGEADDPRGINVTDYHEFDQGSYDFKIDLKFDGDEIIYDIIEDWEDASTDSDLSSVQLELSSEDVSQELSVWSAKRSQEVDNDGDGYFSSVVLTIDVDVSYGETDIYMKVYSKYYATATYTHLLDTDPIHLIEDAADDDYDLQLYVEGIAPSLFDIKFEILFVGSSNVELTYGDADDPDLDNIPFETAADDTP